MINAVSYQFNKFVEFAKERVEAGKESAIARTGEVRIGAGTPPEARAIYSTDKTDFVGMTILRTKDAKAANDEVRELFRKSIAEDPYGNMEKVDKFCTYLENNGPAAFHVADGKKNVDLNWLYREVIG